MWAWRWPVGTEAGAVRTGRNGGLVEIDPMRARWPGAGVHVIERVDRWPVENISGPVLSTRDGPAIPFQLFWDFSNNKTDSNIKKEKGYFNGSKNFQLLQAEHKFKRNNFLFGKEFKFPT
jgi:hypothetical protein